MTPIIQVENFCKSFGDKTIHKDVSFSVYEGECLGLIGGSGTGKSVLLRSLIGLEKPTSGKIEIRQTDVTKLEEKQWVNIRKDVAYAFQGGALFDSMTVYDNMAYPLREHSLLSESESRIKILNMLAEFGLDKTEDLLPANLSGGMQKRLGVARALIMDPKIVLYDEPTSGLDPFNTKKIQEMILQLKQKGMTSIVVTHDMGVAEGVCDRVAILAQGRILAIGSFDELRKRDGDMIKKFMTGELF